MGVLFYGWAVLSALGRTWPAPDPVLVHPRPRRQPGRRLWAAVHRHGPALRAAVVDFDATLDRFPFSLPARPEAVRRHPDYRAAQELYRRARRAPAERVRLLLAEGYLALNRVDAGFSAGGRPDSTG